jgi:hypothetical protein
VRSSAATIPPRILDSQHSQAIADRPIGEGLPGRAHPVEASAFRPRASQHSKRVDHDELRSRRRWQCSDNLLGVLHAKPRRVVDPHVSRDAATLVSALVTALGPSEIARLVVVGSGAGPDGAEVGGALEQRTDEHAMPSSRHLQGGVDELCRGHGVDRVQHHEPGRSLEQEVGGRQGPRLRGAAAGGLPMARHAPLRIAAPTGPFSLGCEKVDQASRGPQELVDCDWLRPAGAGIARVHGAPLPCSRRLGASRYSRLESLVFWIGRSVVPA